MIKQGTSYSVQEILGIKSVDLIGFNFIPDDIPAFFDTWFLDDKFLASIHNTFLDRKQLAEKNSREVAKPFLLDFFNIKFLHQSDDLQNPHAFSRAINALIEAVNEKDARLPKYLVVIMDSDIIEDMDDIHDVNTPLILRHVTDWFVTQINVIL